MNFLMEVESDQDLEFQVAFRLREERMRKQRIKEKNNREGTWGRTDDKYIFLKEMEVVWVLRATEKLEIKLTSRF